jgi:hypothetical protein
MNIRQTYLSPSDKIIKIDHNSIDLVADDGRDLFTIKQLECGAIEISTGVTVKHFGRFLEARVIVEPRASNILKVSRKPSI